MNIDFIESLLQNATQGRRVQFHPYYCEEAKGAPVGTWDTSHDMSVIREDGTRYKIAQYQHAADAALSQAAPELANMAMDEKRRADSLAASLTRLRDMITEATVIGPEPHKLIMEDGTVHTGPAVDFLHQLMELTVSYCDRALEKAEKA